MMEGTTDVGGMLRRMTSKQFLGWEHFAEIEPFSFDRELRADYRAASIVQVIANVNRGKGQRAYTIGDFLLKFDEAKPERKKTWQEMQKVAYMIAAAYNAPGVTD
jgi:hypothetical protein